MLDLDHNEGFEKSKLQEESPSTDQWFDVWRKFCPVKGRIGRNSGFGWPMPLEFHWQAMNHAHGANH